MKAMDAGAPEDEPRGLYREETMPRDYYLVLGVSRGANMNMIKKAYRAAAKKYHPDVSGSAESAEKFKEVREAYETLSDEGKRRRYDRNFIEKKGPWDRTARAPEIIRTPRAMWDAMDAFFGPVDEFFGGLVPGLFDRSGPSSKDLYCELILSPREAAQGGIFPITVPAAKSCPRCHNSGYWEGLFCPVCHGCGRVRGNAEFSIRIPPGVAHGTRVALSLEDIGLYGVSLNLVALIDPSL